MIIGYSIACSWAAAKIVADFVGRLGPIDIGPAPSFASSPILARNARVFHHVRGSSPGAWRYPWARASIQTPNAGIVAADGMRARPAFANTPGSGICLNLRAPNGGKPCRGIFPEGG